MWTQAAVLALLPALALCFSPQDVELFRLRDKVIQDLGEGTTFYSWLGLKKGASNKDITRAFRKLSRTLHPDRNPGVEADERFARLNQVNKVLKSSLRDRYNYYLSAGFPLYNAEKDDWYYKRYRPSLIFTLVLLALIYTGIQLLVLKTSAHRRRQHISDLIAEAHEAAKDSKTGIITGVTRVSHGDHIFVVHPTGEVHFEGTKLSPDLVEEPTWEDTHAGKLLNRIRNKPTADTGSAVLSSHEAEDATGQPEVAGKAPKKAEEGLKKGAVRRRPAAARGKAKIF